MCTCPSYTSICRRIIEMSKEAISSYFLHVEYIQMFSYFILTSYLFTHSYPVTRCTFLADDITAPMKSTMTSLRARHFEGIVPPTATQRLTVIQVRCSFIAKSATCSQRINSTVAIAEIGWLFKENKHILLGSPSFSTFSFLFTLVDHAEAAVCGVGVLHL